MRGTAIWSLWKSLVQAAWGRQPEFKGRWNGSEPHPTVHFSVPWPDPNMFWPGTDMHCGDRAPRRSPLVTLQGPRWGPWHSGVCVWVSPALLYLSSVVSSPWHWQCQQWGQKWQRWQGAPVGTPRTEDSLPNVRLSRPRGGGWTPLLVYKKHISNRIVRLI